MAHNIFIALESFEILFSFYRSAHRVFSLFRSFRFSKSFQILGPVDSDFRDYTCNELGRSDIEGRIPARNSIGSYSLVINVSHFPLRTFFDWNVITAWEIQVNRSLRGCDVKWYPVIFRDNGDLWT